MKTLIITGSDQGMMEVLDLTIPSKQEYCKKYNYDLLTLRSFAAAPECNFNSTHIGFLRALVTFKQLKYYDNVMWIDADAIITNMNYKIEDFIQNDACFIASYDWMHFNSFSTGNFIIRRTNDTQKLFERFITISQHRLNDIMQEQGTLNYIYNELESNKSMFNILPHKFLNSVPEILVDTDTWRNDNNRSSIIGPWTSDCFLAHLTGLSMEERVSILSNNKLKLKQ
jgi:hypothetical protein